MDFEALAKETWRIGRERAGDTPAHAFDLVRRDDGGISIRNVREKLADNERHRLMAHFGKPIVARTGYSNGSTAVESYETREPGTAAHFVAAVHRLPPPFILLPSNG